jgi:hypothetical protein
VRLTSKVANTRGWETNVGILYHTSLVDFLLVTVFLGGGAAYLTGRAVALTWRPLRVLFVYTLLLTAAVRFIHFSLFDGTLLTLHYYLVDLVVLLILAGLGFRITRASQMAGQYRWLYKRSGPLFWQTRAGDGAPGGV